MDPTCASTDMRDLDDAQSVLRTDAAATAGRPLVDEGLDGGEKSGILGGRVFASPGLTDVSVSHHTLGSAPQVLPHVRHQLVDPLHRKRDVVLIERHDVVSLLKVTGQVLQDTTCLTGQDPCQSLPLTDLSQSTLLDSSRSGSVTTRPGTIFLKESKSSRDILEKGRLSGAAAGDGSDPSAPECSFRQQTPDCREGAGRKGPQRSTGGRPAVVADEKVLWGLRCRRAVLSLNVLWNNPTMTGAQAQTGCSKDRRNH
ncbi:hypothetical protein EYF80_010907 [Liparis tanakae]|uniref:Uncharacterized protein n=1 Tax=Liparis tanakae TaxID=230148 RepID=A0A4Z2ILU4_9TELE|nr:hypothetical protein EYF80_010907 [Liparis tanakae]